MASRSRSPAAMPLIVDRPQVDNFGDAIKMDDSIRIGWTMEMSCHEIKSILIPTDATHSRSHIGLQPLQECLSSSIS